MAIHLCTNCNSDPEFRDKPGGDPEVQLVCPVCGQKGKSSSSDSGAVFMWNNGLIETRGVSIFGMVTTLGVRITKLEKRLESLESEIARGGKYEG